MKNKQTQTLASPQQLVDCNTVNFGCIGGWPQKALQYIKENGITDEKTYPYVAAQKDCKYSPGQTKSVIQLDTIYNLPTRGNETWMK